MMNQGVVRIGQESVVVHFEDGKYFIDGYDLESERVALALRGKFGEGIGVLLLALNEYGPPELGLRNMLSDFSQRIQERNLIIYNLGMLVRLYFSFSPMRNERIIACSGRLPESAWARLLADESKDVVMNALVHAEGPRELLEGFVGHKNEKYREALARNPYLSLRAQVALAKDSFQVRKAMRTALTLQLKERHEAVRSVLSATAFREDAAALIEKSDSLIAHAEDLESHAKRLIEEEERERGGI